jgi:hypothetical protein
MGKLLSVRSLRTVIKGAAPDTSFAGAHPASADDAMRGVMLYEKQYHQ